VSSSEFENLLNQKSIK